MIEIDATKKEYVQQYMKMTKIELINHYRNRIIRYSKEKDRLIIKMERYEKLLEEIKNMIPKFNKGWKT